MARSLFSSLFSPAGCYCFQLSNTENNNVLSGREVWLVLHSQPLFSCGPWSTGKRGWLCETKVWPHETRRTAAKKLNTQNIPCCKDWISKVWHSACHFKLYEADSSELDHVIAYKKSSKFNSWNVSMEVNLENFLRRRLPTIWYQLYPVMDG